jgi:hypothetical protein
LGAVVIASGQLNFHARNMIRDRSALWFIFGFLVEQAQLCRHLGNRDLAVLQRGF